MTQQFTIIQTQDGKRLHVVEALPDTLHGEPVGDGWLCPLDADNARAIRKILTWSAPQLVGLRKSFGFGDRLGISTGGHLQAVREFDLFPVLAQQSMREMQRARRSPAQVLDDVTWAVIESGYDGGFGCDADHLKTVDEIDACIDAGYISFTLDPGQFVNDDGDTADNNTLIALWDALDWDTLQTTPAEHRHHYTKQASFNEEDYIRSAVKYGGAVAHVALLHTHIASRLEHGNYEIEVSVDETERPTTPLQHRFIVQELQRLNVDFIGIAPRFVGDFYKGIDYVGDVAKFEADYRAHAQIAQEIGSYKLSIHSGSDKLSIYPIIYSHTPQHVHVKTSGTSWLEALRVIAASHPSLFRQILAVAVDGYAQNRQSYHVNAEIDKVPTVNDANLPQLLNDNHARQVLHVSFGMVLAQFYDDIYAVLHTHIDRYHEALHTHFKRHLAPFSG